ncbi:tRNA pseudouridine synthase A [bioreactor metagenome]|uniref:tRNA pseudouridine synthase A n=1 Tax=bioreactor metagenome TaxID=1076179 RepID=A0A645F1Y8_9ZZZZ|nr:tRNA pseudouridine(38-40) synthase TruA [Candidatus Pelethousia sp.]NCB31325.1 tRNA pseudouridine(38-40) synthase TruA [Clostridia bacterium]
MSRIRMIIQYDGTGYVGWQTQPNGLSVQERLETELKKITGEDIRLHASGRTDSGVHARAQVAHFDTKSRVPPDKFAFALNAGLPPDIRIAYSGVSPDDFHARFDVEKKHYRYTIWHGPHGNPFLRNTALHVHHPLNLALMKEAAALVLGAHDFAAFKAAGTEMKSTRRTVYVSQWQRGEAPGLLYYEVAGSGFLYNMVRILVGTMLEIGGGTRSVEAMARALSTGQREDAGSTAPAHGLTLWRVEYPAFDTENHIHFSE